jgi:hypothetical protein
MDAKHRAGYAKVAAAHTARRQLRWVMFDAEADAAWPTLSKKTRFMFGLALYAGEGSKTEHSLILTNCDPRLLRVGIEFYRMLGVEMSRIRAAININRAQGVSAAEAFWASQLGLRRKQFTKTHVATSSSSRGRRGNKQPYGTCRIKVHDTRLLRMVLRWIDLAMTTSH